jgi:hypothetical protein
MKTTSNLFVYALCGDNHVDAVNTSLQFLKHFTRQQILVVEARCTAPIQHDQVLSFEIPGRFDNHQASIVLKTNLHRLIAVGTRCCCYLDTDIVAIDSEIDEIFARKNGPVTFAADHSHMRRFSRFAVECSCVRGECDHLREAIRVKFGLDVRDPDWQHWNGGVFLFDSESTDFMDTWHRYVRAVFKDPYWRTRDQGALIATAWKHGLQDQPVLPRAYNYIVDAMRGFGDAERRSLSPSDYRVDESYSLDPGSALPRPHFLHFINRSIGARGWKNWDQVEALLH